MDVDSNRSPPNKSLDASGGSVFRNLIRPAEGALIRAAASTQTLYAMISAKVIAPLRGLAPDGDTTEKLKRDFGRLRQERRPFFLEASEFDNILDWKLGSQYGRVSRHRKLLLDTSIPIVTHAAFDVRAAERGDTLKIRTGILTSLPIVGVPVASAIWRSSCPRNTELLTFVVGVKCSVTNGPTSPFRVIYVTCNRCGGSRMNFLGCPRKSNTPFGTTIAKRMAYNKSLDASGGSVFLN